jgi:hypothetical protein
VLVGDGATGDLGQARAHRVRRLDQQRAPTVPAEQEEHVEEQLVAAVAEDELLRPDAVPLRECRAQLRLRRGGRIPVEQDLVSSRAVR